MTLRELAAAIGRSYGWTARNWRDRLPGLPQPIVEGKNLWWHGPAVEAWLMRKSGWSEAVGFGNPLDAANDPAPARKRPSGQADRLLEAAGG